MKQMLVFSGPALSKGGPGYQEAIPESGYQRGTSITGCALLVVNDNVLLPQSIKLSDSRGKREPPYVTADTLQQKPTDVTLHEIWPLFG